MANKKLGNAKKAKQDEFYTQYADIQKEINAYLEFNQNVFRGKTILLPCDDPEWSNFTKFFAQNFVNFGLKKLISTSYAQESKNFKSDWEPTLFETSNPIFDADKSAVCGKIFTLDHDSNNSGKIDIEDLEWQYLNGNGDFRSDEVKRLRDEADIIITNPPFSLLGDFFTWVTEANKSFILIGNLNAVGYTNVFPLLKNNQLWVGATNFNTGMYFRVPKNFVHADGYKFERERDGQKINRVPGCCWFTNIEHGRRHEPLQLLTEADNIKYSKHKEIRGHGYKKYDNYDAIDVPFWDAIPSDYNGIMGVPRTFFDKYCPEQFEIVGTDSKEMAEELGIKPIGEDWIKRYKENGGTGHITANMRNFVITDYDGIPKTPYARILIRKIKQES
jgi:hypothetical protein